jgi:hypothetical protein
VGFVAFAGENIIGSGRRRRGNHTRKDVGPCGQSVENWNFPRDENKHASSRIEILSMLAPL